MTPTEERALALVNEVFVERCLTQDTYTNRARNSYHEALCRAIEQLEAAEARHAATIQPALQEPVAWLYTFGGGVVDVTNYRRDEGSLRALGWTETPLYAGPTPPQWQGIESAPRDGSWIVLYDDRYRHSKPSYLIAQWHGPLKVWSGRKNSKGRFTLWDDATHWMPLPTPPNGGSDAE